MSQQYVFLEVGDKQLASDEVWSGDHYGWVPSSPAFVGHKYQDGMPPIRRAVDGAISDAFIAERDALRAELRRRYEVEKGNVWYWQADGNDHPESLTCQVMIRADDLRTLLGVAQPALPARKTEHIGGDRWGWEGEYNRGWNACLDAAEKSV